MLRVIFRSTPTAKINHSFKGLQVSPVRTNKPFFLCCGRRCVLHKRGRLEFGGATLQKQKKSNFSSLFVVGVIGLVATWLLLWKGVPVIVPIIVHPRSNEPQRRPLPPSRRSPASFSGTKRNPVQSGGDFLGAFSSLCLRLFYPGDRGVGGTGKSPRRTYFQD